MWSWRRWMARLSFSFLILAGICAWEGWRHAERRVATTIAAIALVALFLFGTYVRHHSTNAGGSDEPRA